MRTETDVEAVGLLQVKAEQLTAERAMLRAKVAQLKARAEQLTAEQSA